MQSPLPPGEAGGVGWGDMSGKVHMAVEGQDLPLCKEERWRIKNNKPENVTCRRCRALIEQQQGCMRCYHGEMP
jgi:hypothetical protein